MPVLSNLDSFKNLLHSLNLRLLCSSSSLRLSAAAEKSPLKFLIYASQVPSVFVYVL